MLFQERITRSFAMADSRFRRIVLIAEMYFVCIKPCFKRNGNQVTMQAYAAKPVTERCGQPPVLQSSLYVRVRSPSTRWCKWGWGVDFHSRVYSNVRVARYIGRVMWASNNTTSRCARQVCVDHYAVSQCKVANVAVQTCHVYRGLCRLYIQYIFT